MFKACILLQFRHTQSHMHAHRILKSCMRTHTGRFCFVIFLSRILTWFFSSDEWLRKNRCATKRRFVSGCPEIFAALPCPTFLLLNLLFSINDVSDSMDKSQCSLLIHPEMKWDGRKRMNRFQSRSCRWQSCSPAACWLNSYFHPKSLSVRDNPTVMP